MTNQSQSIEQRLEKWLATQGYVLEFTTHAVLKNVGLSPLISHYVFTVDNTLREIDVSVSGLKQRNGWHINVIFCCECKYSHGKPWLLMDSEEQGDLARSWAYLPHSPEFVPPTFEVLSHPLKHHLNTTEHFQEKQRWAHSLTQGLRNYSDSETHETDSDTDRNRTNQKQRKNLDAAYDSLRKISDAAWDWSEELNRMYKIPSLTIAIPCIVVDGPLYRANFVEEERRFQVTKIPFGRLLWSGCRQGTLVDVVQADSLPTYAVGLKHTIDTATAYLTWIAEKSPPHHDYDRAVAE